MRHRSIGYSKKERNGYVKVAIIIVTLIGVIYYGILLGRCYNHFNNLLRDKTTSINLLIGDK